MASTQQLKGRIGSVKNTKQITKAMELVSASKMRRAQSSAVTTRDYRLAAHEILKRIGGVSDVANHPLFVTRPVKNRLVVMITSDRGLAGAYNGNVLKQLIKQAEQDKKDKVKTKVIAIGRNGANFAARFESTEMISAYPMFARDPKPHEIRPIVDTIFKMYSDQSIDAVNIIYTGFISNITQEVHNTVILPTVPPEAQKEWSPLNVAIFEPDAAQIIEAAVTRLIEVQIWQAVLESLASEHSMRMVAMKNATDNANDVIDDLTLALNTARQADITQQIAEIVGGAEAVAA